MFLILTEEKAMEPAQVNGTGIKCSCIGSGTSSKGDWMWEVPMIRGLFRPLIPDSISQEKKPGQDYVECEIPKYYVMESNFLVGECGSYQALQLYIEAARENRRR
jgi:hypothetical protein